MTDFETKATEILDHMLGSSRVVAIMKSKTVTALTTLHKKENDKDMIAEFEDLLEWDDYNIKDEIKYRLSQLHSADTGTK
jgi:hypothetical protein